MEETLGGREVLGQSHSFIMTNTHVVINGGVEGVRLVFCLF